jgi:hypothetical protein
MALEVQDLEPLTNTTLIASTSGGVRVVSTVGGSSADAAMLPTGASAESVSSPKGLAYLPGVGLFVREMSAQGRLQLLNWTAHSRWGA